MIYDLIYDSNGNVIDAYIMNSTFGKGKYWVNTKIPTTVSIDVTDFPFSSKKHNLFHNSIKNTNFEEGLIEGSLHVEKFTEASYWKNLNKNIKDEYSILRFIQKDNEENAILNYNGEKYNDCTHNNEQIYLPNKTESRLKFNKLYIEKTVNVHTDDIVIANDELIYTITVKNNSKENYTDDITVTEYISDYVTYKENDVKNAISFNEDMDNKKLEWNIGKLNSGEEIIIKYTVMVKENCYGKTIESIGTVDGIPSAILKNTIRNNLTQNQANSIIEKYEILKDTYTGKELVNEIYKEALNIDLKFNEFDITDLIKNPRPGTKNATSISLNDSNRFYNSILNKYWSTLYSRKYNYSDPSNVIAYDLKSWRGYTDIDRRADTICGENFKTGDILIYKNSNDLIYTSKNNKITTTPITYEDGEYAYIYIEGKGFVGVNLGNDGVADTQDDRNEFNYKYYSDNGLFVYSNTKETDENILEFANYQTLFGKDYYVILRPALSITSNWQELKNKIENSEENTIEIKLNTNLDPWVANSKITIKDEQNVTLIANSPITITRMVGFTESFFENRGTLTIKTKSQDEYIILDGNNENIQANGSLIYIKSGNAKLSNICLQNNTNSNNGGGLYISSANVKIENSVIDNNTASAGGGIFVASNDSNVELENVKITRNTTKKTSGGGIYAQGNLKILGDNTSISNNSAVTYGGGITAINYTEIEDGKIEGNSAGISGGGISINGEVKIEKNVNIGGNTVTTGNGEDIFYTYGYLTFDIDKKTAEEKEIKIYPDYFREPDWTQDSTLNLKTINVSEVKSLKKGSKIEEEGIKWNIAAKGASGMTVTDKYIVFAQVDDNGITTISILDKNNFKILNIIEEYSFRHANDMAYNPKTNEIYILTSSKEIAKFKIDDEYNMTDLSYIKDFPRGYSGFAYDEDDDYYIGYSNKKIYIINNEFKELYNFECPTQLTDQGISYWNNHIFFSCYESLTINKGRNVIYMYNMDGSLENTLYIPETTVRGEIEAISFDENGTLLLEYNMNIRGEKYVNLYKSDIFVPEPIKYTITYNLDGGEATSNPTEYTIESEEITLNNPSKAGYIFKGWTGSNGETPQTRVKIEKGSTGNKEYTANWEKEEKLTIDFKGYKEKINNEIHYLENINPDSTIEELEKNIETNGTIKIYRGTEEINKKDTYIETGMKIEITKGEEKEEIIAVVTGDLNGDGIMDDIDVLKLARYKAGLDKNLQGEYLMASDLIKDENYADDADLLKMVRVLVKLDNL